MATQAITDLHGFDENPIYDGMIHQLARLAAKWRGDKSDEVAEQYQTLLKGLLIMGWRGELPVEVELPDRLLPESYLSQFPPMPEAPNK
jgi:hypothetical protein